MISIRCGKRRCRTLRVQLAHLGESATQSRLKCEWSEHSMKRAHSLGWSHHIWKMNAVPCKASRRFDAVHRLTCVYTATSCSCKGICVPTSSASVRPWSKIRSESLPQQSDPPSKFQSLRQVVRTERSPSPSTRSEKIEPRLIKGLVQQGIGAVVGDGDANEPMFA